MSFTYSRTVHFQDTDAAGVVYFANVLAFCHEAYEASLAASGVDLEKFFSRSDSAVPIVHANVDFFRPLRVGDRLEIHLMPQPGNFSELTIDYQIFSLNAAEKFVSRAQTRHVCIHPETRQRQDLPQHLQAWLHDWCDLPEWSAVAATLDD